jgi:hypothetical protein
MRLLRRAWTVAAAGVFTALAACGDETGPSAGLTPGTFAVKFELAATVATPAELRGRHDFTFRVRAPATSVEDFELLGSRRLPPGDVPAEFEYLRVDPDQLVIDESRWQIRLPYAEGDFGVSVTLRGIEGGGIVATAGCYGRAGASASYLGAGCVIERQ